MHPGREASGSVLRRREIAHKQILSALKRSLARTNPTRILDVGTGFGMNVEFLARRFRARARIWSVDPSTQVLGRVRNILGDKGLAENVTLRRAKAEDLPFATHRFDLVLSVLSLHHLSDPVRGLHEMSRVLAPKGKMVIADWKPVKSPVVPHAAKDIPSPRFVLQKLELLGLSAKLHETRYWYVAEATR